MIKIGNRVIGNDNSVYIIAELSANHNQNYDQAVRMVRAAKTSGADAVKIQTYTPDTITIDCNNDYFQCAKSSLWEGKNLYNLYSEAYTPWDWQPKLKVLAGNLGLDFFSTPFDHSAVDYLENMSVPSYKIASFEVVDLPLIRKIAKTGKPIIMSTGMATLAEVDEAIQAIYEEGNDQIALLKCTSSYPALPEEMNLKTIPHLAETFSLPVGLSDHTQGFVIPIMAVALGACIVEKHFTLDRSIPGPDSAFSLEPNEFRAMVEAIRIAEQAAGEISFKLTDGEKVSQGFRRSLFVVEDIKTGESFTAKNVRSIRPGYGLHTRYLDIVLGRKAKKDIERGTPLSWNIIT